TELGREAVQEARALVAGRARIAEDSLDRALAVLAERFGRETGVAVGVEAAGAAPLPREAEVVLLRAAQEALANIRKHSGAARARLALDVGDAWARLTVSDDGRGLSESQAAGRGGFGLAGLADRVRLAGGEFAVRSGGPAPWTGAVLTVRLPVPADPGDGSGP
ncbi:MAG: hypothetical protein LBT54_02040, partial [Bifidobacteriaceae bacterium]|nr:hypothetical protein [Bifidobacteriaceae bacterium]